MRIPEVYLIKSEVYVIKIAGQATLVLVEGVAPSFSLTLQRLVLILFLVQTFRYWLRLDLKIIGLQKFGLDPRGPGPL